MTLLVLLHSCIILPMSFLFSKKTQKVARFIWGIIAVLIIISMVLLFSPGVFEAF